VGESATVELDYDMSDNNGGISSSTVTITVNGTNDAVSFNTMFINMMGNYSGSVTEVVDNMAGENTDTHTAGGFSGGLLPFADVDLSDVHTVSVLGDPGYLGALTADFLYDSTGFGSGLVKWDFSVNDSVIDHLNAGEVLTQNYTVTVSDGDGGSVDQNVEIEINGAADLDLDIVVFDLVQGVSSGHSGRDFDAGTDYTIYIKVDSSSKDLHTSTQPGSVGTWGNWTGAEHLTSDDQIIFIGTGAALEGPGGVANTVSVSVFNQGLQSANEEWAVRVQNTGYLIRATGTAALSALLWTGTGVGSPALEAVFASAYETAMPTGILTSQGLA
jgi:VCBS repeat-containing protein